MDELDLLKKDWNKKEHGFKQHSEEELYGMTHRSSSSIVKWLLVISVLEFAFWGVLTVVFNDEKYQLKLHRYGIEDLLYWINMVNYVILVAFIFVFYKNYRAISTTDATQKLMHNILRTRKTVKYYIGYNLVIVAVNIVLSVLMLFYHNAQMQSLLEDAAHKGHREMFLVICWALAMVFVVLIVGLFSLFYKLLYGILLRKLFANYKELKKTEL